MIATVALAWSLDRAAGIAALLLASATIAAGLLQGRRGAGSRMPAPERHALHEGLAMGLFAVLVVHLLAVAFDPFLGKGLVRAIVPFAAPYRPFAVGLGQLAAFGLLGLSVTFYARRRLGVARWRAAHRFVPAFWLLAVLHAALAGSDFRRPWFLVAVLVPTVAAFVALLRRWDERSAATVEARAASVPRAARSGQARAPAAPTRTAPDGYRAGR